VVVNPERLGLAGNWNRCVAMSRTPFVAIFHQDDLMDPGHLASHLDAIKAVPEAGLIASSARIVDENGEAVPDSLIERGGLGPDRTFPAGDALPLLAGSNPLRCSGVTIAEEAHRRLGGFDPSYRYVVDWEFWLRVAREWPIVWRSASTVAFRWHSSSETHRFKTGTKDLDETIRLVNELFAREGASWADGDFLRKAADRRLARAFLNRSYDALKNGDPALARTCLFRAVTLRPAILATIASDPRLAPQMAVLAVAPGVARRVFSNR
ncbi:glycosyltransferase, partial [Singulisphaera rosea]